MPLVAAPSDEVALTPGGILPDVEVDDPPGLAAGLLQGGGGLRPSMTAWGCHCLRDPTLNIALDRILRHERSSYLILRSADNQRSAMEIAVTRERVSPPHLSPDQAALFP